MRIAAQRRETLPTILPLGSGVLCFILGLEWSSLMPPAALPPSSPAPATEQTLPTGTGHQSHPFHQAAPLELHFANISVPPPASPFLCASILQARRRKAAVRDTLGGLFVHADDDSCQYALLGASMGCSFVAVEPVPLFRALLELNIQLNPGLPATGTVLPYAVGLENKGIQMQVPLHGSFGTAHVADSSAAPGGEGLFGVDQRRLDDMLGALKSGCLHGACMLAARRQRHDACALAGVQQGAQAAACPAPGPRPC
ncbi:hypothetical protein ABPG77_002481 [Micractinium sp. CCAP 211/92]